jgi:DNA-binding winged helix-turn-helix (wHTH) protein
MLYSFEDLSLDTARRELRRSGTLISLQPQVFDLLEFVIRNRERVVSKDDLLAAVWNGRIVFRIDTVHADQCGARRDRRQR